MADRNGATVDIQAVERNAKRIGAVQHLDGEGFIQFPQVDVFDFQAGFFQQLRDRKNRADTHFIRLATGNGKPTENTERLQALGFGNLAAHDDGHRCAIRKLAGITGRDHAAGYGRANFRDGFDRRVAANAFIGRDRHFLRYQHAGGLVGDTHDGRHRHNFIVEFTGIHGSECALLALHAIRILTLAADVVALGDSFRRLQHRPIEFRLVLLQPDFHDHVVVGFLLHARDRLDAAGGIDVAFASDDALRCRGNGLQTGRAKTIDRHACGGDRASGA